MQSTSQAQSIGPVRRLASHVAIRVAEPTSRWRLSTLRQWPRRASAIAGVPASGWRSRSAMFVTVALIAAAPHVDAAGATFIDLGTLGGSDSYGRDVNNAGQVAGGGEVFGTSGVHATRWTNGVPRDLGTGSDEDSVAYGINTQGQVVGLSRFPAGAGYHATRWDGAARTDLGTLGGAISSAAAINDTGTVVGSSQTTSGLMRATVWKGSTPTELHTAGSDMSAAININAGGAIVGYTLSTSGRYEATVWNGPSAIRLGTLGGLNGFAEGINDAGQIVGTSDNAAGQRVPTLWVGTTATALAAAEESQGYAADINNLGQIVGTVTGHSGLTPTLWSGNKSTPLSSFLDPATVDAGYVLWSANAISDTGWVTGEAYNERLGLHAYALKVPVIPEPTVYALLLAGLGVMVIAARVRRRTVGEHRPRRPVRGTRGTTGRRRTTRFSVDTCRT